jgi:hypothetical protein
MAINPYQFESTSASGAGSSTNFGGNEYGYDLNTGDYGGTEDPNSSGFDLDFRRKKKDKEPQLTNANVRSTNKPPTNAASAAISLAVPIVQSIISSVKIPSSIKQPSSTPAPKMTADVQSSKEGLSVTPGSPSIGSSTNSGGGLTANVQSERTPSTATQGASQFRSPSLPTIGYGDAGAAQAAASQAGAGSVTPEQSSQWRMQQAQEANQRAYSTPRDYSSINNANAQRTQQAQEANRNAYSTPRDYSSLGSQFRSPTLPTVGYGDPQAAASAAGGDSAGYKEAARVRSQGLDLQRDFPSTYQQYFPSPSYEAKKSSSGSNPIGDFFSGAGRAIQSGASSVWDWATDPDSWDSYVKEQTGQTGKNGIGGPSVTMGGPKGLSLNEFLTTLRTTARTVR